MSTNIIQQMKAIESERERMFAIYCADTGSGDMHRPFDNYRAGYKAATSLQEAKIKALTDALEQIKHSITQMQMPGNDKRREVLLIQNIVALALAKETP